MNYYSDWKRIRGCSEEAGYISKFLDYDLETLVDLTERGPEDALEAVKVLLSIPIEHFINVITRPYSFESKDVFQYSKLDDAIGTLCTILAFEEYSLSFEEAGKKLTNASQQYACIEYGENHAKTAAMLNFVSIKRDPVRKCNLIRITPLGSIAILLSDNDKRELVKRLAIRNPFVKTLLFCAKQGDVDYCEIVSSALTGQTIIRRRHNNEIIVNMILEGSPLKDRIRWH